jgi:hypothetical protein
VSRRTLHTVGAGFCVLGIAALLVRDWDWAEIVNADWPAFLLLMGLYFVASLLWQTRDV